LNKIDTLQKELTRLTQELDNSQKEKNRIIESNSSDKSTIIKYKTELDLLSNEKNRLEFELEQKGKQIFHLQRDRESISQMLDCSKKGVDFSEFR